MIDRHGFGQYAADRGQYRRVVAVFGFDEHIAAAYRIVQAGSRMHGRIVAGGDRQINPAWGFQSLNGAGCCRLLGGGQKNSAAR